MGKLLSKRKIKPLFIGFGNQALAYADVLNFLNVKISAVCVTNVDKNATKINRYKIDKIFNSLDKALSSNTYNCIFIFLPWHKIEKKIIYIMQRTNKIIFCEKPLALSLKKIMEIKTYLNKYNKRLYILYNRRYLNTLRFLEKKRKYIFKSEIFIPEKKDKLVKILGKKIIGKIKYHYTSHWLDFFNVIFNKKVKSIKKEKNFYKFLYNNIKNINFKLIYSEKKTINAKFHTKKSLYKLETLEKLYKYSKTKKKYIIIINDNTINKFKPGILNLLNCILKNKLNKLRKIDSLINDYKVLQKLPF